MPNASGKSGYALNLAGSGSTDRTGRIVPGRSGAGKPELSATNAATVNLPIEAAARPQEVRMPPWLPRTPWRWLKIAMP